MKLAFRKERVHVIQLWLNLPAAQKLCRRVTKTYAPAAKLTTPSPASACRSSRAPAGHPSARRSTNGRSLAAAGVVELATPDEGEQTKVMLFAGQPLGEPVVVGGPFVTNSRAEIEQAFRAYHKGNFGPIPRLARIRQR